MLNWMQKFMKSLLKFDESLIKFCQEMRTTGSFGSLGLVPVDVEMPAVVLLADMRQASLSGVAR